MFGIIAGLFASGCAGIGKTIQSIDNTIFRNQASAQGKRVYYDHFGGARDVKTNKDLIFGFNRGDKCYFDVKGNIVYNLTQEERLKELTDKFKNLKEGQTAVLYKHSFYRKKDNGFDREYRYEVYVDVATNKLMYEKKVAIWMHPDFKSWEKEWDKKHKDKFHFHIGEYCNLYFDIDTDQAIRISDHSAKVREQVDEQAIIDMVNDPEWRENVLHWLL